MGWSRGTAVTGDGLQQCKLPMQGTQSTAPNLCSLPQAMRSVLDPSHAPPCVQGHACLTPHRLRRLGAGLTKVNEMVPGAGHALCMTRLLRLFLGLITALSLALSGPAAAGMVMARPNIAQGADQGPIQTGASVADFGAPVLHIVICGAEGAKTIWLDAAGNPVPAPSDLPAAPMPACAECPICLATDAPALSPRGPAPWLAPLARLSRCIGRPAHGPRPSRRQHQRPDARGPPSAMAETMTFSVRVPAASAPASPGLFWAWRGQTEWSSAQIAKIAR